MTTDPELERIGVHPGQTIAGRYRVERLLGKGGMGVVVAATHTTLADTVAIKFMVPAMAASKATTARFLREAQAAGRIKSRHVARVIDFGTLDNEVQFMVMEYLEGMDLGRVLKERGALDVELAGRYALEVCEGLAAAHALGIVHRDIKPGNLFAAQGPGGAEEIKLLDFGISKVASAGEGSESLTRTYAAMGSPSYMAPEQMRSARDVDARADQWSLGIVLFELVTGKLPFHAESLPELCSLVLETTAPPVRSLKPDLPERLERVLSRCLARDRDQRYADVAELARELGPLTLPEGPLIAARVYRALHGSDAPAAEGTEPAAVATAAPTPGGTTNTTFGRTRGSLGPRPGSRRLLLVAAAGVVGLGALLSVLVVRGTGRPQPAEPGGSTLAQPGSSEARTERPPSEASANAPLTSAPVAAVSASAAGDTPPHHAPARVGPRRSEPRSAGGGRAPRAPSPFDERK